MSQHLPGAHHISDYLLATAKLDYNMNLDQLQLNKLCYLVNGFTLRERDDPAYYNNVEAWKYGPVVPEVYVMYKIYGDKPITQLDMCRTSLDNQEDVLSRWENLVGIMGTELASISSGVLKEYGQYTGYELVSMMHKNKTPWKKVYKPGHNNIIPTKIIRQFYKDLDVDDQGR
ncbi:MAG: DUF4065 domain-containing protein [Thaumarchaeota archaeon]|nr:DUF4065 domain-containing protein [Nitrososphaerota archaeon]